METHSGTPGMRVRITNYSPFRGLNGTIQRVHIIDDDAEDAFCFYLIALDSLREPIWFERGEIEFLDALRPSVPHAQAKARG